MRGTSKRRAACGAILAILTLALPVRAELPPTARDAIDAMLECEREEGGWMYVCPPERGSHGVTKIVNLALRASDVLGLPTWDLVVLRSPGTPAAGLLLVEAWERTGDPSYIDAARRNGDLLLQLQLPSGGWFSEMPVHGQDLAFWFKWYVPWATLDDDVTTGAVRFLLRLFEATGDPRYRAGAERGLDLLVRAQLRSGAWPLTYRPVWLRTVTPSFEDLPSLNDAATASVISTLLLGAEVLNRPDLVEAAAGGGDWLVASRFADQSAGWAQQYDEEGRPVPGRAFEPVALASWETKHALGALAELARVRPEERYCTAIEEGLAWLESTALSPGCWARFISLDTGAPVFLDIDGHPVPSAVQAKRPYRWTGDYGIPSLFTQLGRVPPSEEVTPRIPGDAGDCPGSPRRARRRRAARNPRARIGEAGSQMGLARAPLPPPCAEHATKATP